MLKSIYQDFIRHRYFYLCLLLLGGLMSFSLQTNMQGADGRNYLRWAHSFIFDQDLHLLNDFTALGGGYRLTPTGFIFERVNIGPALWWLPFYCIPTRLFPLLPGQTADMYPPNSAIALGWVNFTSWLYPILAGILTFSALRRWFSNNAIGLALVSILLGTPVLFYMATFPMSAHPVSIFLAAVLLYLWLFNEEKSSAWWYYLTLGIIIGWLMMIATYNIVFFILPGMALLKTLVSSKEWRQFIKNNLAVGLGGLLGFLPQMIVFWFLFGSPFYSPYSGQLLWTEPYLLETLFSTFHGLFFFAPVLLLVIPGLWQLRRRDGWLALSLGLIWLTLAYIVSINVAWWAGSSFGNRYFLTLTPFLGLGLASFIQTNSRWGWFLIVPCVLWTVGLYLQFLSGIGLTSDSVIYPAVEIATGQLTAYAHILNILPQLAANWPWGVVVPVIMLPVFVLILVGVSRLVYGWAMRDSHRPILYRGIILGSLGVILFVIWAGWRGEQTKAALAQQGFYNQPHEVILREVKEVAGKSGLVTRAMFHEQMNQPDKAIADLQLASAMWKPDDATVSERFYLGSDNNLAETPPRNLLSPLDYPGDVRLIGYRLTQADNNRLAGELFWEKLPGEKSRNKATPVIRAFDGSGKLLGNVTLNSPFPAYYIPAGGLFRDRFLLPFDSPPTDWIWLGVSMAEEPSQLPLNRQGQAESGLVASVNITDFSSLATQNTQGLLVQPLLLGGDTYYHPGQNIPIQIVLPAGISWPSNSGLTFTLSDSTGKAVAKHEFKIRNQEPSGSISTYCLPLIATLPTGSYQLSFALQPPQDLAWIEGNSRSIQIAPTKDNLPATICNLLKTNFSRRYEVLPPQNPVEATFEPQIKLLGYDFAVIPQQGSITARVVLYWQAQADLTRRYLTSVQLWDAAHQPVMIHTDVPAHGLRPTSTWLKQEFILDEHSLNVPSLAPGEYQLILMVIDEQTGMVVENSLGQPTLLLQKLLIP